MRWSEVYRWRFNAATALAYRDSADAVDHISVVGETSRDPGL